MKKQNKIYSISTGVFGYNDINIKPDDDIIVWLDNHGFTHVYYCTAEKSVQSHINIIKKQVEILIVLNMLYLTILILKIYI